MEMCKGFSNTEYLKLDFNKDADVETAINALQSRLSERFIEPAEVLIKTEEPLSPKDKKFGFTVLAIDCLLIETIQSFYSGVTDSTGQSKSIFIDFLTTSAKFKSYFPDRASAEAFYKNFRCGILHQAQTTNQTKVHAIGPLISQKDGFTVVNRLAFHEAVKDELEIYIRELRNNITNRSTTHKTLFNCFTKKMRFIAAN